MDRLLGRGPDPSVGDEDIHPPEPIEGLAEQVLDLLFFGQIGGHDQALPDELPLERGQGREVLVAVEDEVGPFTVEQAGRCAPDPPRGAGDEDDLILKAGVHR